MRALTVKQPWASLIASGLKQIENRTYPVPKTVRGARVAIHAGKGFDDYWHVSYPCTCGAHGATLPDFVKTESCEPCKFGRDFLSYGKAKMVPRGRILCTARIVGQMHVQNQEPIIEFWEADCPKCSQSFDKAIFAYQVPDIKECDDCGYSGSKYSNFDESFYENRPGVYGWILADVELVNSDKIHKGTLGFWTVKGDL